MVISRARNRSDERRATDHNRGLRGLLASLVFVALVLLVPSPANAGVAATEWAPVTLKGGSDTFDNYDYVSESRSSYNVDWAMDLVFTNNATLTKVGNDWKSWFTNVPGSDAWAWVDGEWSVSKGFKQYSNGNCVGTSTHNKYSNNYHFRIYAPSAGRMYSVTYGYFVVGSSHNDYAENCGPLYAYTGDSEAAENYVTNEFHSKGGFKVYHNDTNLDLHNLQDVGCDYPSDGIPHCWDNTGKASRIEI